VSYYYENVKTEDTSGLFPTLKGCIAAAEGVAERDKQEYAVYAQTSQPTDLLVGTVMESEIMGLKESLWVFDFDPSWPFEKRY
jgi:hypothetical protein